MIALYDVVALIISQPDDCLEAGDIGVVVDILDNGIGYLLEIFDADGGTIGVIGIDVNHVRRVEDNEPLSARPYDDERRIQCVVAVETPIPHTP